MYRLGIVTTSSLNVESLLLLSTKICALVQD